MVQIEEQDDDSEEESRKVDKDGWMDLMDGKIQKRILKEGCGKSPEVKQDVRCSLSVRLAGDGPGKPGEHDEVLLSFGDMRYRIGEGEAVPMLELGLRFMKEGEEAEIYGVANMAWGPEGLKAASPGEKPVPSNANIKMHVVLFEVIEAPVGEEDIPWIDLIQTVTWRKTNGNDHFRRQLFQKAARSYTAGIEVFQNQGFEPPENVKAKDRPAAKAAAMSLVTDCGANLAAVYLELNEPSKAKETAQASLEMCPRHIKCIYRAAKACMLLDEFDECESLLKRGLGLDPANSALLKVEADLGQKQRRYEARSKKLAGCVFKDLDYPDLVAEKAQQVAEWEEQETWRYWFKEQIAAFFARKTLRHEIIIIVVAALSLLAALFLLSKRHWPLAVIGFVLGLPLAIGFVHARNEADKADEKGSRKRKKQ